MYNLYEIMIYIYIDIIYDIIYRYIRTVCVIECSQPSFFFHRLVGGGAISLWGISFWDISPSKHEEMMRLNQQEIGD
jgi:hypothetical protein